MDVVIVNDIQEKKMIVEKIDFTFPRGLVHRDNYDEIFEKINKFAIFIAAYDDNLPVGYAAMYANDFDNKTAYISMFGVINDMKRKKIGTSMMEKCIDEAKRCGMSAIKLEVLKNNIEALAFYKKTGFEVYEECSEISIYLLKRINS